MSNLNYRHGHHEVEARRHDGSTTCAEELAKWIREYSGHVDVIPKGEFEWDRKFAFLRIHDRFDRLVQPNFWIVRTVDNQFYSVYPTIFKNMYRAIDPEVTSGGSEAEADPRRSVSA